MTYKNKLVVSISAIFLVFAGLAFFTAVQTGDNWKKSILRSRLEGYSDTIAKTDSLSEVVKYLPEDMRVTIMSEDGTVVFDSYGPASEMDNHLLRQEVQDCIKDGEGWSIRKSVTTGLKYFYLARKYDGRIVRTAEEYRVDLDGFLRSDWLLVLAILLLLLLAIVIIAYLSARYDRIENEKAYREKQLLKHEMTGNISHELKTPVASIQGYLETIITHPELPQEKKEQYISRSYAQTQKLSEMMRDISLITKLEEAPEQFKVESVNLKDTASDVVEEMGQKLSEKEVKVYNDLPPVCVKGNYNLIYSIFRNLVENSVKYSGGGCEIHMSGKRNPSLSDEYELEYYDTGRGVAEDKLDKIFERFYRIDSDRATATGGSGLGLSIVRNAVLFHHGGVSAYSVQGGGLGFKFTLKDL